MAKATSLRTPFLEWGGYIVITMISIALKALSKYPRRGMAQITIRNLDDAVMQALRRRATAAGRSTEEEARRSLAIAVGVDLEAARAQLDVVRSQLRGQRDRGVATLVREMRDERTTELSG